jgi:hypothetical protein
MKNPIAFYPKLAELLGDIPSAIYYQQLNYWSDKGSRDDGFIYKSKHEIQEETTLTREQQDRIKAKLVKMGWLETKLIQVKGHPVIHYKTLKHIDISISGKPTNGKAGKPLMDTRESHLSSTKTTTENTPLAAEAADEFSFEEYLKNMRFKNPQRHINIIGDYWDFKGFSLPSAKACSREIARCAPAARELCEYDEMRVNEVMDWLWQNAEFKWTLESVVKHINEDLAKLKTKGRKK